MMKEDIKKLNSEFKNYIKILKSFEFVEKSKLNDFAIYEDTKREELIKLLNEIKEDYF